MPGPRRGRRPGTPDTRTAILASARAAFAERGYDGASIRAVAAGAGVDPALVHHYFGTKEKLFVEVMGLPVDPQVVLSAVAEHHRDDLGPELVRTFLSVWDPPAGAPLVGLLRSAVAHEWVGRLLREFMIDTVLRQVAQRAAPDAADADLRATLVASQMMGLAMARYVVKVEPLASAPPGTVVAAIGPVVQRYLTGDLRSAAPDRTSSDPAHDDGPASQRETA